MNPIMELQKAITAELGKEKLTVTAPVKDEAIAARVAEVGTAKLEEALSIATKMERYARLSEVKHEIVAELAPEFEDREGEI